MTRSEYGMAYEAGFPATARFLASKGLSHDCAVEFAQAAWTRGWERIAQLRNEEVVTTWINTIALNMYRRNTHIDSREEPFPERAVTPDSSAAAIELRRLLDSCCPSDRMLLLYQLQGFTTSEMAREVGVTEAAVRIRLMRARRSARSLSEPRRSDRISSRVTRSRRFRQS